ncbi:hypothetical protein HanRHA438_Chr14g0670951 [Helianthus annuus]|nr:hypothetical protein HanRHA438_Chr14g0670951 [Helianthus annuus]
MMDLCSFVKVVEYIIQDIRLVTILMSILLMKTLTLEVLLCQEQVLNVEG